MTRYLIVGNGAAGATAAETIRGQDPQGAITVVGAEPHPMYSRPGLAYVVIDEIPEAQVIARRPEWYRDRKIKLVHGTAVRVDPLGHQVHLADGQALAYDRLLIATGARAVPLPYPGANLDGVVFLDTLDGTRDMLRRIRKARRAVVIGGGITALEMAEGFVHHKLETHYFLRRDVLWASVFNAAESKLLEEQMRSHGVQIHFNTEAAEVLGDRRGRVVGVKLKDGKPVACDLVGAGIGVKPQLDLIAGAGLKTDKAILVNEFLEASAADVFAAGDCAQAWDPWTRKHMLDVLWPTAIAQGRAAGLNMAGGRQAYVKGVPFNACLLFGLHITAIGQLGGSRESDEPEVVQHISRGSSEVWATRPHAYTSAWHQHGANTLRLALSGDRLVGALVVGDQAVADALRFLIEEQIDIGPLRPLLAGGGPDLAWLIQQFYLRLRDMPADRRPVAAAWPSPFGDGGEGVPVERARDPGAGRDAGR
jgi:NAD(P)H-nitrite reductase large subunit